MGITTELGPGSSVVLITHRVPVRVAEDCSIGEAAEIMHVANTSSVLVAGEMELNPGIVTERDLARALAAGLGPSDDLSTVVVRHPVAVSPSMSIVDAAGTMLRDEIRHLLLVDHGETVGIVSMRDVMAVLLRSLSPEAWVETLRDTVAGPTEIWVG